MAGRILAYITCLAAIILFQVFAEGNQDTDTQVQNLFMDRIAPQPEYPIKNRSVRNTKKANKNTKSGKGKKITKKSKKGKPKSRKRKTAIKKSKKGKLKRGKRKNATKKSKKNKKGKPKSGKRKKTAKKSKKGKPKSGKRKTAIKKSKKSKTKRGKRKNARKKGKPKRGKRKNATKKSKKGKPKSGKRKKTAKKSKKGKPKSGKHKTAIKKSKKSKTKRGKRKNARKKSKKGKPKRGKRKNATKKSKKGKPKSRKRKTAAKKTKKGKSKSGKRKKATKKIKKDKPKSGKRKKAKKKNKKRTGKNYKRKRKIKKIKKKTKSDKKAKNGHTCDECVVKLANYAKLYVAQAKNRKQQILRMEKACETSKKKLAKKGLFQTPFKMLLENAGGNKTDLKCKGKSISVSITSSSNTSNRQSNDSDATESLTDMTKLEKCNATIANECSSCQLNNATMNASVQACKMVMMSFISKMDDCLNGAKYPDQASLCTCVDKIDPDQKLEKQIRDCSWVTNVQKQEVEVKKKCVSEFSSCRKAEDNAVGHLHKCKLPLIKCGGVTTAEEAQAVLPVLKSLKTELDATEAKIASVLTKLGMDALDLAKDGKNPVDLDAFIKNPDGTAGQASKCRDLAKAWLKFNESAVNTGEKVNDNLDVTEGNNATNILKQIQKRDLEGELGDCKSGTQNRARRVLITIIRFYMAMCIRWRRFVIEVKIIIIQIVITDDQEPTKEPTKAPTTEPVSTAKAGIRKKKFLDAMKWLKQKIAKSM